MSVDDFGDGRTFTVERPVFPAHTGVNSQVDWEHDVYESWRVVFGRISLPPPTPFKSAFQQAIEDIQAEEDRRTFEMLNVGKLPEIPDRFEKIDSGVLDNLRS